ncbi:MAG: DUF99 family protein [Methanospirillum sp.]
MHVGKPGLRVLGIAESYRGRHDEGAVSHLAGVVMRRDRRIDGFGTEKATVGGSDATDAVVRLVRSVGRDDVRLVMLSGAVIAWFNVIDAAAVAKETGCAVVSVTYEASPGLESAIARHFPGDADRLAAYRRLGERVPVPLSTGATVYVRPFGLDLPDAAALVDAFTLDGGVPEPLRAARIIARGLGRA